MSIPHEVLRELQYLVELVNRNQQSEKGGYFALSNMNSPTPDLITRVGAIDPQYRTNNFEQVMIAGKLLFENRLKKDIDGAIRTKGGTILVFAGYPSPWNSLLMLALAVCMGWMEKPQALDLAGENSALLANLFKSRESL